MLSDLWAHVWPAPCIVTQNDSPSVGADLLRDWLGPVAPGWSIFFNIFSLRYSLQRRGVHCLVNHVALHSSGFCTACAHIPHYACMCTCVCWVSSIAKDGLGRGLTLHRTRPHSLLKQLRSPQHQWPAASNTTLGV